MTFHDRQLSFMSFQAWIMKFFNVMTPTNPVHVTLRTVAKSAFLLYLLEGATEDYGLWPNHRGTR